MQCNTLLLHTPHPHFPSALDTQITTLNTAKTCPYEPHPGYSSRIDTKAERPLGAAAVTGRQNEAALVAAEVADAALRNIIALPLL